MAAATTNAVAPARQLSQKEADIQMMLAEEVHLGTKNCDFQMERYVFKRRSDGIYTTNLGKTWDKLQLAARVIVAIENPKDIIVQSARPYCLSSPSSRAGAMAVDEWDGAAPPPGVAPAPTNEGGWD